MRSSTLILSFNIKRGALIISEVTLMGSSTLILSFNIRDVLISEVTFMTDF